MHRRLSLYVLYDQDLFVCGDGFRMSLLCSLLATVFGRLLRDFAWVIFHGRNEYCISITIVWFIISVCKCDIRVIEKVFKSIRSRIFC